MKIILCARYSEMTMYCNSLFLILSVYLEINCVSSDSLDGAIDPSSTFLTTVTCELALSFSFLDTIVGVDQ